MLLYAIISRCVVEQYQPGARLPKLLLTASLAFSSPPPAPSNEIEKDFDENDPDLFLLPIRIIFLLQMSVFRNLLNFHGKTY